MFVASNMRVFFYNKPVFENWDGIYTVIFYKDAIYGLL